MLSFGLFSCPYAPPPTFFKDFVCLKFRKNRPIVTNFKYGVNGHSIFLCFSNSRRIEYSFAFKGKPKNFNISSSAARQNER